MNTALDLQRESLAFFLPLHNEEVSTLPVGRETLAALGELGIEHHLILVDDGSTDATPERALELQAEHPERVTIVTHDTNLRSSQALKTGFRTALGREDATLIGFMDGDGQFSPKDIATLALGMTMLGADVMVGIRQHRQDTLRRRIMGAAWKLACREIVGCNVKDPDCGFKLVRRPALEGVMPYLDEINGAALSTALIMHAQQQGRLVGQVPVRHGARLGGTSSTGKPGDVLRASTSLLQVRRDLAQARLQAQDAAPTSLPHRVSG